LADVRSSQRRARIASPGELQSERQEYLREAGLSTGADAKSLFAFPDEDVFVRLEDEGFESRSIGLRVGVRRQERHATPPDRRDLGLLRATGLAE
jgi:hypothetical protein